MCWKREKKEEESKHTPNGIFFLSSCVCRWSVRALYCGWHNNFKCVAHANGKILKIKKKNNKKNKANDLFCLSHRTFEHRLDSNFRVRLLFALADIAQKEKNWNYSSLLSVCILYFLLLLYFDVFYFFVWQQQRK